MDKEQQRNSPGEWDAKQQKNILLTRLPFGLFLKLRIPKNPTSCVLYIISSEFFYLSPNSKDYNFSFFFIWIQKVASFSRYVPWL